MSVNRTILSPPFNKIGGTHFFDVVFATIKMDLSIRLRYRANFVGQIVRSLLFILIFILFAGAYQFKNVPELASRESTFLFFISGFIFVIFDSVALWVPLQAVFRDLYNGTLEYIYSCPSNRIAYFIGVVISAGVIDFTLLLLPMIGIITITGSISVVTAGKLIIVVFAMLAVLTAFGTMFSLMVILWKQVSSIPGILSMLFQFLSGFFFPVSILPRPIQFIAYLLPYTWAIDIARSYVFGTVWTTILPVPQMWLVLLFYGIVYWSIAAVLIKKVEEHSKRKGLHLL